MNFPAKTTPEYSELSCCLCGEQIDTTGWYACYETGTYYAHSACFQKNREQGHSQRLTPSKFTFYRMKAMNPFLEITEA